MSQTDHPSDNPQEVAAEHLRIIRTLLERSQVYRAISAPAALVGGVLSLAVAARIYFLEGVSPTRFLLIWMAVLLVTAKLNALLLFRAALEKKRPFLSAEMKLALKTLMPALVGPGLLGLIIGYTRGDLVAASLIWIIGYGCALLATASFSPPSLTRLGGCFVAVGLLFAIVEALPSEMGPALGATSAAMLMGLTFGLLHLVYGTVILLRPGRN
jgi:hypothetical protein